MDTTTQDNPDYIAIRPEVKKLIDIAKKEKWEIFDFVCESGRRISPSMSQFPYIYRDRIKINEYNELILAYNGEVEMVNIFFLDVIGMEFEEKQDFAMQDLRKYLESK